MRIEIHVFFGAREKSVSDTDTQNEIKMHKIENYVIINDLISVKWN